MKIELNKQLDIEVFTAFADAVVGGADFGKIIRDDHPTITKQNHIEYINKYYATHRSDLERVLADTQRCYDEMKDILFAELRAYFGKEYGDETYTCYVSIFNCNPRYLESRSFQVYYKRSHNMRKEVIAHELTHFAFFDFCFSLGISNDSSLWELSEIFNVTFLNLPPIQSAIGAEELLFYPDLHVKLEHIRAIWEKKYDAETFIRASLEYLRTTNTDIV